MDIEAFMPAIAPCILLHPIERVLAKTDVSLSIKKMPNAHNHINFKVETADLTQMNSLLVRSDPIQVLFYPRDRFYT